MKNFVLLKYQIGLILLTSLIFGWFFKVELAIIFGGLISVFNALLLNRHIKTQKTKLVLNAKQSFNLMLKSIFIRLSLVAFLVLFGFWLALTPEAVVFGLAIGQIGFLLDKFLGQKR